MVILVEEKVRKTSHDVHRKSSSRESRLVMRFIYSTFRTCFMFALTELFLWLLLQSKDGSGRTQQSGRSWRAWSIRRVGRWRRQSRVSATRLLKTSVWSESTALRASSRTCLPQVQVLLVATGMVHKSWKNTRKRSRVFSRRWVAIVKRRSEFNLCPLFLPHLCVMWRVTSSTCLACRWARSDRRLRHHIDSLAFPSATPRRATCVGGRWSTNVVYSAKVSDHSPLPRPTHHSACFQHRNTCNYKA